MRPRRSNNLRVTLDPLTPEPAPPCGYAPASWPDGFRGIGVKNPSPLRIERGTSAPLIVTLKVREISRSSVSLWFGKSPVTSSAATPNA